MNEEVNYDLMCECVSITKGESEAAGLLKVEIWKMYPQILKKPEILDFCSRF